MITPADFGEMLTAKDANADIYARLDAQARNICTEGGQRSNRRWRKETS